MADYNLDRFSVLVVEDNPYMRSLLVMTLKTMGVGTVKMVDDGAEAIETLRLITTNPRKAGIMSVDIIFSNWQMSPVDGLLLLRWVRRHKDSPDQFVPFVMVTGFADRVRVGEARDLGVTEMLAKPYSVDSVASRLLQVIDRPRQFVRAGDYFGPDRRRLRQPITEADRRKLTDRSDNVEIVYG